MKRGLPALELKEGEAAIFDVDADAAGEIEKLLTAGHAGSIVADGCWSCRKTGLDKWRKDP